MIVLSGLAAHHLIAVVPLGVVAAQEAAVGWPGAFGLSVPMALLMVGVGLLVLAVAERGADGSLGRNAVAGIRTPATTASDEAWLAAHWAGRQSTRIGGWIALCTAPLTAVVAAAVGLGGGTANTYLTLWTVLLFVVLAAMLAAVIHGAVVGIRAAKAINEAGATM